MSWVAPPIPDPLRNRRPVAVAGTGHRPQHLPCAFDEGHPFATCVQEALRTALDSLQPRRVISGMALGFDTWLAEAALEVGIDLVAAVPFQGQEARWRRRSQLRYRSILNRATEICIVSNGGFHPAKMHRRNDWMLARLAGAEDLVLALWSGRPQGGTAATIRKARALGREPINLWPSEA